MNTYRRWTVTLIAVILFTLGIGSTVYAADEAAAPAGDKAKPSAEWQNQWYLFWGPANVHARLAESEKEINTQINGLFGKVIPNWRRPHTFKNWSRDFKLWDLHSGIGRDLGPKFSVYGDTGLVLGVVKNDEDYWPFNVRVRFSRRVWFVAAGLDYYPWGKPDLISATGKSAFVRSLKAARPYLEGAIGYVHAREGARVKFGFKDSLTLLNINKEPTHSAVYASPRVGVEFPLGKNDSIKLQAGYLFFKQHHEDLNNWSYYILHSHRF